jgi:hypothetical protein
MTPRQDTPTGKWRSTMWASAMPVLSLAVAFALLTLTAPPAEGADRAPAVSVCGEARCVPIRDREFTQLIDRLFVDTGEAIPTPSFSSYYLVRKSGPTGLQSLFVVPRRAAASSGGSWFSVPPTVAARMERRLSSLRPYAPPSVVAAALDGKPVPNTRSIGDLLRQLSPATTSAKGIEVLLRVEPNRKNPWLVQDRVISWFPESNLFSIDGTTFKTHPSADTSALRRLYQPAARSTTRVATPSNAEGLGWFMFVLGIAFAIGTALFVVASVRRLRTLLPVFRKYEALRERSPDAEHRYR